MAIMDVGRLCRITCGRNALDYCVILEKGKGNDVMIQGVSTKNKKINVKHLEPTPNEIKVKKTLSSDDIIKALNDAGLN